MSQNYLKAKRKGSETWKYAELQGRAMTKKRLKILRGLYGVLALKPHSLVANHVCYQLFPFCKFSVVLFSKVVIITLTPES